MTHNPISKTQPAVAALFKYLEETGIISSPILPLPTAAKSLPIFISQIYKVHRGTVADREYTFLICEKANQPTPSEVEKHYSIARSSLGPNVTFVFPTLPAFNRKRLIERHIPFIVPGRQTYLPMILIDLREKAKGGARVPAGTKELLSSSSQALLLYQLEKNETSIEWPLNKWVQTLGYSRSTLTRSYKELASASLCRPIGHGRQVILKFPAERRVLWDAATPHLQSPIFTRSRVRINKHEDLLQAGLTALATLTDLAAPRESTYALTSAAYRTAIEEHRLVPVPHPEDDSIIVERWRYAPRLLSPDEKTVDRLSLFLSLRDNPDERIQVALASLLETASW